MAVFYLIAILVANCTFSFNLVASNINDEISEQKRSNTSKERQQDKKDRKSSKTKEKNSNLATRLNELNILMPTKVLKKNGTSLQSSYPGILSYPNLCRIFLGPLVTSKKDKVKSSNVNNGPKIIKMSEEPRPDKVEIYVEIGGEKVLVKCSHKVMHRETTDEFQKILGLVRNITTHQLKSVESVQDGTEGPEPGVKIVAIKHNVILPDRAIHTLGTKDDAKSSLVQYQIYKNEVIVEQLPSFTMAFTRKQIKPFDNE